MDANQKVWLDKSSTLLEKIKKTYPNLTKNIFKDIFERFA